MNVWHGPWYCFVPLIVETVLLNFQSGSQPTRSSSPPNFCYVLTVQDSSQAVLCQEADVYSAGECTSDKTTLYKVL